MNTTNYPGINYAGFTGANSNPQTGIRYGVIPSNDISPDAFEDIVQHGADEDFEAHKQGVKQALRNALSDYFSDYKRSTGNSSLDCAVENAFDSIADDLGEGYESSGDCTRYSYDKDGVKLQVASDGDIFVLESPFFTYAQFCSPCAPGACYLRSPLETPSESNKAYCLGHGWFDSDSPCPYPVYSVATGELIQPKA